MLFAKVSALVQNNQVNFRETVATVFESGNGLDVKSPFRYEMSIQHDVSCEARGL